MGYKERGRERKHEPQRKTIVILTEKKKGGICNSYELHCHVCACYHWRWKSHEFSVGVLSPKRYCAFHTLFSYLPRRTRRRRILQRRSSVDAQHRLPMLSVRRICHSVYTHIMCSRRWSTSENGFLWVDAAFSFF